MASETQRQSSLPLLLLLLILLGLLLLFWPALNVGLNSAVQNASSGQCQSAGQSFDARQEAFTLAQAAESYRSAHPFRGNYGLGSYTLCFSDGSQQRVQSNVFKGYDNPSTPVQSTHSEQATYGWLQNQFSLLTVNQSKVTEIDVVIFSQVIVCIPCRKDMVSWQQTLRQKAKTNHVYLSIWDIMPGKGFFPATYPAGSGVPVTENDLQQVAIRFVP